MNADVLQLIKSGPQWGEPSFDDALIQLAGAIVEAAAEVETKADRQRTQQLAALMNDRAGQVFTTLLTDRIPQLRRAGSMLNQARHTLSLVGVPSSFSPVDTLLLKGLKYLGWAAPSFVGFSVRKKIVDEAEQFLIRGGEAELRKDLQGYGREGTLVNVNRLGEEVLGNHEAERHLKTYSILLKIPEVETISVKVSSVCAQLSTLAMDDSVERVSAALRQLYRVALECEAAGSPKLVMLDMEAYRDLELTHRAFVGVLSEPEFLGLKAGIVLQAYLPDTHLVFDELHEFAKNRMAQGGAPLQIRIVKGANLAAEQVESSHRGWACPIYPNKALVDASFKALVIRALSDDVQQVIRVGIASHNLFDVAFTLLMSRTIDQRIHQGCHFEVLAGMAEPLTRVLKSLGHDVLVYCPSVGEDSLHTAVAYLVRRMDENTSDDNYLRHSFNMRVGDASWERQVKAFRLAMGELPGLDLSAIRTGRGAERPQGLEHAFVNESDTDFTHPDNRKWLLEAMKRQSELPSEKVMIDGVLETDVDRWANGFDPNVPENIPYQFPQQTAESISKVIQAAVEAREQVSSMPGEERIEILRQCAQALRQGRSSLIAALVMDGGKNVLDADAEVSEAIDFAEYYANQAARWYQDEDLRLSPRGVTVVTSPWNFPLAIPLGGVFAAFAMGNSVILKPSNEAPYAAWLGLSLLREVGLNYPWVQMAMATDENATQLITHQGVDTVVLTGGTSTGELFLRLRPELHLLAETGGKNSTIVTEFADRDLAVHSVVASAFGHGGQKCSATSLLILTEELAQDASFQEQLIDAVKSLPVGSAWGLENVVTPLIQPPQGDLLKGLTTLEPGESWWVEPVQDPDNPHLWSPGIRFGVREGSYGHLTEFFGPVLGVMVARDLEEALRFANGTPYGLTAGLHSLDEREQTFFLANMNSGNLYVNRTTTGAIVGRQPFGGRKASCFGPGAKAGGPNYVLQFATTDGGTIPSGDTANYPRVKGPALRGLARFGGEVGSGNWESVYGSYRAAKEEHYDGVHEEVVVLGQDNWFRYQPARVLVVLGPGASRFEASCALMAAEVSGADYQVVLSSELAGWRSVLEASVGLQRVAMIGNSKPRGVDRIRALGNHTPEVTAFLGTFRPDVHINREAVSSHGLLELRHWHLEQSVSRDYHRYGNMGWRGL